MHHGVHSRSQHGPVVLVVGVGLVNGALGLAAHPLHVLLVLLLDVLHPDVVDAVKQSYLHTSMQQSSHSIHLCCEASWRRTATRRQLQGAGAGVGGSANGQNPEIRWQGVGQEHCVSAHQTMCWATSKATTQTARYNMQGKDSSLR